MKKKIMWFYSGWNKEKKCEGEEARWATAHFPALVTIQQDCIMTGRAQARARA